jgi:dihydroorotase
MKMNPPLRTAADVASIREALANGVIDVIASDHAPHTVNEKDIEFDRAAFGVIGLETELAVSISELLERGVLNWPELIRKLSYNPSCIVGIERGSLAVGAVADISVVAHQKQWIVDEACFVSRSRNSCFLGKKVTGVVEYAIREGKVVYSNAQATACDLS